MAAVVGFAQAIGYWDEITAWFASLLKALFHSAMPPLPAPSAPPPQASEALVDVSAYAPPRVRKGTQFLVQVFVHDPAQEREAATLAKEADFKAVRRGIATLDVEIAIGERLDFMLEAGGLTISKPLQGLVWRGTPQSRSFIVTVPQDFAGESAIICVQVLRQSVPIGQISFSMELVADVAAPTPGFGAMSAVDRSDWPLEPMGDAARRFRRAFLSYASPDRLEVVRLARMLPAVHMEFFQDLLSLEPGEEWESRLYREIEDCDLFLLFWSNAARKSIWVNKELDHALEYARKAGSDRPKIQPVLIEGPPPPDPPEALPHLHFNDPNLYMVFALERLAEKHPAN